MPPAAAGSGLIFVANEGLTALATIMPPTVVGSEIPLAFSSPIPDLSMIAGLHQRAWGNSNFSCIIRRAAECKLPVPELSDTGRKCYSIACLGDLSRRRFTEDGSLGEDGAIVDCQSSITFGDGDERKASSEQPG
jgi:hypothetical protein